MTSSQSARRYRYTLGPNALRATLTLTFQTLHPYSRRQTDPSDLLRGTVLTGGTVSCGAGWNLDPVCTHGTATVPSLNLQLEPTTPLRRGGPVNRARPPLHGGRRRASRPGYPYNLLVTNWALLAGHGYQPIGEEGRCNDS